MSQPGQPAQTSGSGGMVNDARDKKKRPFVERVGQNSDDYGQHCGFAAESQKRGQYTELADRRVCEQRFHVPVPHGHDRPDQHRDAAKNEKRP